MGSKLVLGGVAVLAISGSAMAADLSMPMKAAAPVAAVPSSWDGAYIGGNAGYAWDHADHTVDNPIGDFDMTGGFVGGQIGYNFHLTDGVVLGVQGDIEWSHITGTDATITSITNTINWTGAVTARLGYDAGQFMPYVLGGVAMANNTGTGPSSTSQDENHTGWTIGAGLEAQLADNLSGFVEYRYSDYGQATYSNLPNPVAGGPIIDLTSSTVRAGLNYHF
ncbi:MAG: porin family protein [Devosia sp.]|nr:porin family protein [Devosia sp.]